MSLLSFNWDNHFIYAIIYWILEILVRLGMYLRWQYYKMSDSDVENEYIYVVFLTIADLFAGFLVLYVKCTFQRQRQKKNSLIKVKQTKTLVDKYYDNFKQNKNKNLIKRLLIICTLTYLSRSLYWISYAITGAKNEDVSHTLQKDVVNSIDIFMRCIFSIFILHIVIHRHRIVSMGGILVGFCILLPADFILLSRDKTKKLGLTAGYVALLALRGLSIPFEDTLIKILYTENYLLPEKFMLFRGITVGVIIIVITPILYFSFGLTWKISFQAGNYVSSSIYIITSFVKSYFLLKIIFHFSSQSVSFLVISESVSGSVFQIIGFVNDKDKEAVEYILVTMELIGIFIIAFSTLIYDEVVIINKWELNRNVRKGIISRGEEEVVKSIELELAAAAKEEDCYSPDNDMKVTLKNEDTDVGVEEED